MSARLEVRGVTVAFGDTTVLDEASLDVAAGEIVAILGPSGSGKSTLLRVVAGLVAPGDGRVLIDDADVTALPTHRRGVGMVFQDNQLFSHLDVAANVAFGLRMSHVPAKQRNGRVSEMLGLVGLAGFERRSVTDLSGGEAKRVALARSLAPSPRVLLLDEPLTGLDRELHDRLAADLAGIMRAERTTSLLVTHDRSEAETVADRVVELKTLSPRDPPAPTVEQVRAAEVHDLRRTVLRSGTASDEAELPGDDDPSTRHLAIRDAGAVVAVATLLAADCPDHPGTTARQLRMMAVAPSHRGRGLGATLVAAAIETATADGAELLWANARDTALGFYQNQGFAVTGNGFVTPNTGLPHHRIVKSVSHQGRESPT